MALMLEIDPLGAGTFFDYTSVLLQGSLTVRANTVDFTLIEPASLGFPIGAGGSSPQHVRISALSWLGTIAVSETVDIVEVRNGQSFTRVTATNSTPALPIAGGASMTMSDQPTASTFDYLLEDGSGHILMEDGSLTAAGALQLEGGDAIGYQRLSVLRQVNTTVTIVTTGIWSGYTYPAVSVLGKLTTFQGGLWPGLQFKLYSNNQAYVGTLFTVTEIMITFPADLARPVFEVTFTDATQTGDSPWTLNRWVKGVSTGG